MDSRSRRIRRFVALGLPFLLLVLAGCTTGDRQDIFDPKSQITRDLAVLFQQIIWWAVGVFVVVEAVLLVAIIRFRQRPGQGLPAQVHGNTRLEVAWTIAPAVILATIAVPTVSTIFKTYEVPTGPDVITVDVIGHQFWWEYKYQGLDIPTASELVVPVGKPVLLRITSADVIHSYWIPKLAAKRDAIGGHVNTLQFVAETPGTYFGQCAEFCGLQHANMKLLAIVMTQADYDNWLRGQRQQAATPSTDLQRRGAQLVADPTSACIACHSIAGVPTAVGKVGPNLTHFGSRQTIAGALLPATTENLTQWLKDPQAVKPGNKMAVRRFTDDEISAMVAYLQSLK